MAAGAALLDTALGALAAIAALMKTAVASANETIDPLSMHESSQVLGNFWIFSR